MRYRRLGSGVAIAVTAMVLATLGGTADGATLPRLPVDCVAVGTECLLVEVATNPVHRTVGMRGRPTVRPFDGMLFEFPEETSTGFTMSGTIIPLTVGFYDSAGDPVGRLDMEPCLVTMSGCPVYRSPAPYRYALEVEQGHLPDGRLSREAPGCATA